MEEQSGPKGDGKGRLYLQAKITREVMFKARDLARSHGISMEQLVEWSLRNILTQAGVKLRPERERVEQAEGITNAATPAGV